MRAVSLFCVLAAAHLLMLAGHTIPLSLWSPAAYFWQDTLIALVFGAVDRVLKRDSLGWTVYTILVVYAAVNVPITRILSSPLTWTMMNAARGPLRDSVTHYFNWQNIGAIGLVAVLGVVFPLVLRRTRFQPRSPVVLAAIVVTAVGSVAVGRIDTAGLHRNAFGVLWPAHLPRAASQGNAWQTSPFPSDTPRDHLSEYKGAASGRNVILVLLESTAAQYLPLYGARQDPMPNFTKLAANSIVFERAYSVYPESIKGLLSVLCSRYPAFQTPAAAYSNVGCPSLAQLLSGAGYRSALFHSGRFMYLGMEAVVNNRGFQTLEDAGAIGGNINSSFGVDEPATVHRILTWIDSRPNEPFFITYLPVAGHHPYATPKPGPFSSDTEFGDYLNALHYGDESLGELLRGLHERNLEDKTLFVLLGDHGEAFGQHESNSGHSLFIYDENVRVPYVIAAPGLIRGTIRAHTTASLVDTAPTILDLLGRPVPSEFQGRSLLDSDNRMALFFTDYSLGFLGLYDVCWKYIFEIDSGRSKLYDVCRDPEESKNLSENEGRRIESYRTNLQRWIGAQRP